MIPRRGGEASFFNGPLSSPSPGCPPLRTARATGAPADNRGQPSGTAYGRRSSSIGKVHSSNSKINCIAPFIHFVDDVFIISPSWRRPARETGKPESHSRKYDYCNIVGQEEEAAKRGNPPKDGHSNGFISPPFGVHLDAFARDTYIGGSHH